jgi:glycosyltransferase involved in cell wall biosynthesis
MKIAILAHVRQRIRQPFCGGMEAHAWHLADGLQRRGHDVTLFASGDSDPAFRIDPVVDVHYERIFPWAEHRGSAPLIHHLDTAYAAACDRIEAGGFDVVHNNSLHRFPLEHRRTGRTPTVTSLHVPPYDAIHGFVHQSPSPRHRITVTSQRQLEAWWPGGAPETVSVLHNGIDIDRWPYGPTGNGFAIWCGRITPNKGTHLAAQAAMRAGMPLTIFGAIEDPEYWEGSVAPLIGGDIRYGGHLDTVSLAAEMKRASLFVFTPCWDEPFGLVAAEAMACGLPVAAFDMGAAGEVIGNAGVLAQPGDVDGLAAAIRDAVGIPRDIPRRRVVDMFSQDLWLARCEALYEEVCAKAHRAAAA